MQQFPERILKTFFIRRHFVSECQRVCVCVCERLCVCACEWRKIVFDLRVMLPRTHTHTDT